MQEKKIQIYSVVDLKHLPVLVEDVLEAPEKATKSKYVSVLVKVPKDHSYYHIEHWFPGDTPTIRVDFKVFWPVAKMYKDDEFSIHDDHPAFGCWMVRVRPTFK